MKTISSDIEFDAPTQVQMCSFISQGLKSQISHLQKTYTKNQFTAIINQLGESDPLYYCDKQSLQLIYDKTVQHQGELNGTLLADFAVALKDKNKEKFNKQIALYKEYIQRAKIKKSTTINSKDLLNYVYEKDEMGYLTECVYELLEKQENVSIKKVQDLIQEIQYNFKENSRLSVPKKLSLKNGSNQEGREQFEEMLYDVVDREGVDIEGFRKVKDEMVMYLDDPMVRVKVERQMNRLEDVLLEMNERKIPSLKEEVVNINKMNSKLSQQLGRIYEQLEAKSHQLYQTKTKLMELTQQNRKINKELINKKIELNQSQQTICQLQTLNNQIKNQLEGQKQSTKQFFLQYQNLQHEYNSFLQKLALQNQKKQAFTQLNFFPTLSLKQQLQDARFKINQLKQQQALLQTQLQNNQNAYIAQINSLQQQLQQAKNYAHQTLKLKSSQLSKLSQNFQTLKQSNYSKKSIFGSVVSLLTQSNKPNPKNSKMSIFLDQVQDFMRHSKTDKLINSKINIQKPQFNQNHNQNQQIQGMLQIDQQINIQYLRQSKANHLKFNFGDVSVGQLRKKLSEESPSILNQEKSQQKLPQKDSPQLQKTTQENTFLSFVQIISKDGSRFKKYLMFNRKGVFMFDTKLRLQKEMNFSQISKITFTYYNLDCFVISFKRKEGPMKKKKLNHRSDMIFKCLRAKQLVNFLSQPLFKDKTLLTNRVRILIEKQQNMWIRESTQKEIILSNCGNFYNPFRLNLSLKNHLNNFFYAELSRQKFFSRNYIIICIVEESGVYCFEWTEDEMESKQVFVYLLPFVKRMLFVREIGSVMVKMVYEDWPYENTFLLRFKNNRESLKFETVCKDRLKNNLDVIEARKKLIETNFPDQSNSLDESVQKSFQRQLAHEESQ